MLFYSLDDSGYFENPEFRSVALHIRSTLTTQDKVHIKIHTNRNTKCKLSKMAVSSFAGGTRLVSNGPRIAFQLRGLPVCTGEIHVHMKNSYAQVHRGKIIQITYINLFSKCPMDEKKHVSHSSDDS